MMVVGKDDNFGLSMVSTQGPYLSFAKGRRIDVSLSMDFTYVIPVELVKQLRKEIGDVLQELSIF